MKAMIEYILMAGIVATVGAMLYSRNRQLEDQEPETVPEPETATGFDLELAKIEAERKQQLLSQYEKVSTLVDDTETAIQCGESMEVKITYYNHTGDGVTVSLDDVQPETLHDFAVKQLQNVGSSLSENST